MRSAALLRRGCEPELLAVVVELSLPVRGHVLQHPVDLSDVLLDAAGVLLRLLRRFMDAVHDVRPDQCRSPDPQCTFGVDDGKPARPRTQLFHGTRHAFRFAYPLTGVAHARQFLLLYAHCLRHSIYNHQRLAYERDELSPALRCDLGSGLRGRLSGHLLAPCRQQPLEDSDSGCPLHGCAPVVGLLCWFGVHLGSLP